MSPGFKAELAEERRWPMWRLDVSAIAAGLRRDIDAGIVRDLVAAEKERQRVARI